MLEYRLDTASSILYLRPQAALEADDLVRLAKAVDPYIEASGDLAGIIIEASAFPGWDSLGAMAAHFRFVRDHHKHIKKIAVVTDAALGAIAEKLGSHFISATVKHFPAGDVDAARRWIASR
jgi:hypothetical protein